VNKPRARKAALTRRERAACTPGPSCARVALRAASKQRGRTGGQPRQTTNALCRERAVTGEQRGRTAADAQGGAGELGRGGASAPGQGSAPGRGRTAGRSTRRDGGRGARRATPTSASGRGGGARQAASASALGAGTRPRAGAGSAMAERRRARPRTRRGGARAGAGAPWPGRSDTPRGGGAAPRTGEAGAGPHRARRDVAAVPGPRARRGKPRRRGGLPGPREHEGEGGRPRWAREGEGEGGGEGGGSSPRGEGTSAASGRGQVSCARERRPCVGGWREGFGGEAADGWGPQGGRRRRLQPPRARRAWGAGGLGRALGWATWGPRRGGEGHRLGRGWKPTQKRGEREIPLLILLLIFHFNLFPK
jgi:hypothetical protein